MALAINHIHSGVVRLGLVQDCLAVTANPTQYRQLQLKESKVYTIDNYHLIQRMSILILKLAYSRSFLPSPAKGVHFTASNMLSVLEAMNSAMALHYIMHCGGQRRRVFSPGIRVYRVHRTYIAVVSGRSHYSFQGFLTVGTPPQFAVFASASKSTVE